MHDAGRRIPQNCRADRIQYWERTVHGQGEYRKKNFAVETNQCDARLEREYLPVDMVAHPLARGAHFLKEAGMPLMALFETAEDMSGTDLDCLALRPIRLLRNDLNTPTMDVELFAKMLISALNERVPERVPVHIAHIAFSG